jgi:dipeptidyl aminopeptidase/acylaminoacyl peptidase
MRPRHICITVCASLCLFAPVLLAQTPRPPITLDEYLNTTEITEARLSPDGTAAVIATESPDWKANNYRHDLWLWTAQSDLRPLTHSGSEENAQWSPDGKWIAFVSDRALSGEAAGDDGEPASDAAKADRLWVIPVAGGEALPLYREKLDVHAYAWSPASSQDGPALYYSVTAPLTHEQEEAQKADWKDVVRWRQQHRGDVLVKQSVLPAQARTVAVEAPEKAAAAKAEDSKIGGKKPEETVSSLPPGAETVARSAISITEIAPSPDGKSVAFVTGPVHHRIESPVDYEIFQVAAEGREARQLTHNEAVESGLRWSSDSRWLHFTVQAAAGSLEDKYRDVQGRLYRMDPETGKTERLGSAFDGSWEQFTLLPDGREIALGLKGIEDQLYLVEGGKATKLPGLAGSYAGLEPARNAGAILVRHSAINEPTQVYLAPDPLHPDKLTALTNFNPICPARPAGMGALHVESRRRAHH